MAAAVEKTTFGHPGDGTPVFRLELQNDSARLGILTFGATWHSFHLAGRPESLVLGAPDLAPYVAGSGKVGATIGPIANRVSNGLIARDGVTWRLERNLGEHSLHGGKVAFNYRNWEVASADEDAVVLTLDWSDPTGGYPGRITVRMTYRLEGSAVRLLLEAEPDRLSPLSLTNHAYFNLSGGGTVDDHTLIVHASQITETGRDQIPTGKTVPAATLGITPDAACSLDGRPIDNNFCLAGQVRDRPVPAAEAAGRIARLSVKTTEPGLQIYTGDGLRAPYAPRSGLCFEAQQWPDSPNNPGFPDPWFGPSRPYRSETVYRFQPV